MLSQHGAEEEDTPMLEGKISCYLPPSRARTFLSTSLSREPYRRQPFKSRFGLLDSMWSMWDFHVVTVNILGTLTICV